MDKNSIIESLNDYIKTNPKLLYYKDCLDKIKTLPEKINKLPNSHHYLEAMKIHICYNMDKFKLFIYDKAKKDCVFVKYKLTDDVFDKLIFQLVTIKEHNDILGLADPTLSMPVFKFSKVGNYNIIYLLIYKKDQKTNFKNKSFELGNLYESMGYVFGVDTFKLLKYQRLDRIVEFIKKGGESFKIYKLLNDYLKMLQKFDWQLRERMMVHSGVIYQALGTTYTRDIDIMVLQENNNRQQAQDLMTKITKSGLDVDPTILINDGSWMSTGGKVYKYKSIWQTQLLPALGGAMDIYETMSNPTHSFNFMGVKFISIEMNFNKFLTRSNPNTFIDLMMVEELNNYNFGNKLCVPNMTIRQGRLVVFDEREIEKIHNQIQQKLREYYNKNMDLPTIRHKVKKCMVQSYEIYKGPIIKDPDTNIIKAFHMMIKDEIYRTYTKNVDYLLDVGSGQLSDLRFWDDNNIKHVYGIEPSIHSIKKGYERIEKFGTKGKVEVINSVGNIDWSKDDKFKEIMKHKYDVITYQYTLHYMLNSIDLMIKNMKAVIKPGTKVIITCMDGNKIQGDFMKFGKVEIRNEQEPIFAIVPKYNVKESADFNGKDILVYFKGAYGVANGSIEPIIDINKLVDKFGDNGFKLLQRKSFIDYNNEIKPKMKYIQKQVSSYYMLLAFEYTK
jgi:hypothetical protein